MSGRADRRLAPICHLLSPVPRQTTSSARLIGPAERGRGQLGPSIETQLAACQVKHLMDHVRDFAFALHARAKAGVVEPAAADGPDAAQHLVFFLGKMLLQPFFEQLSDGAVRQRAASRGRRSARSASMRGRQGWRGFHGRLSNPAPPAATSTPAGTPAAAQFAECGQASGGRGRCAAPFAALGRDPEW